MDSGKAFDVMLHALLIVNKRHFKNYLCIKRQKGKFRTHHFQCFTNKMEMSKGHCL